MRRLTALLTYSVLCFSAFGVEPADGSEADVHTHTGSFNYSVPIPVPPGIGGLQPSLQLYYSSSQSAGPYGWGWNLNLARIERSIKFGPQSYTNADTFVLVMNGASNTLLDVGGGEYRSKIEDSFLKITKAGTYWKVRDRNGTDYFFGLDDLAQNSVWPDTVQTFRWWLSKVVDIHGNTMRYYYQNDANGHRLVRIDYNYSGGVSKNQVFLTYEPAPVMWVSYRSGFREVGHSRLATIETFANGQSAGSLLLTYVSDGIDRRSRLTRVTFNPAASGTTTNSRSINFQYTFMDHFNYYYGSGLQPVNSGWNWDPNADWRPQFAEGVTFQNGIAIQKRVLLDMNGDSLPDGLELNLNHLYSPGAPLKVFVNNGSQISGSWVSWNDPATVPVQVGTSLNSNQGYTYTYWGLVDMNGDGLQDRVGSVGNDLHIYYNTGYGFSPSPDVWFDPIPYNVLDGDNRKKVTRQYWTRDTLFYSGLADVNGDGLPDRISIQVARSTYIGYSGVVYFANGAGFDQTPANISYVDMIQGYGTINGKMYSVTIPRYHMPQAWMNTGMRRSPLLTTITGHQGLVTSIEYKPSDQYNNNRASNGENGLPMNMWLVSRVATSGPGVETRSTTYSYSGGWYNHDPLVQEFRGFSSVTATDMQTGMVTSTVYLQDAVFQGRPASQSRILSGVTVSSTTNTWLAKQYDGGMRNFPYIASSVTNTYELTGGLVTTTTTYTSVDDFGNPVQISILSSDGHTQYTSNTYSNDTTSWLLGRLTYSQVTRAAPGVPNQTRTTSFAYDAATGQLKWETIEPNQPSVKLVTGYWYDTHGNRIKTQVSGQGLPARITTVQYDADGLFPLSTTNALGHTETYAYDARFGKKTSLTGPNGLTTTWDYDGFGRRVSETRADGTVTTIIYNLDQAPFNVTTYNSGQPWRRVYYDVRGREIRSEVQGFNGTSIFQTTEYDAAGRLWRKSRPYLSGAAPQKTTTTYDALGRVSTVTAPNGGVTYYTYNGLTTTVSNPLYQTRTETRDSQGKLIQTLDAMNGSMTYTYDAFGNLIRTVDASGNVTTMTYDIRGRKTSMTDPDMGSWTYAYNPAGELTWQQDAKGQITTMAYDLLGRMTSRTEAEGTSAWTYDTGWIGKPATVTGPGGFSKTYSYDAFGMQSQVTTTVNNVNYTVFTTYDNFNRIDTVTYPDGFATKNIYNANHYLSEVRNFNTGITYWRADSLDAEGRVTQESLGNGLVTTRQFNPATGTVDAIITGGGNLVQNLTYTYDAIGNLTSRSDSLTGLYESFGYDALNRLTSVTGPAPKTYQYDAIGNITFKTGLGYYAYNANRPHAVSGVAGFTLSYDANGNFVSGAGNGVVWTSFNKPASITTPRGSASFTYDADHNRLTKTAGGSTTVYIGKLYEKVIGGVDRHYVYAAGRLVCVVEGQAVRYMHADHLGSVSVITNELGQVLERLSFDAFGRPRNPNGTDGAVSSAYSKRGFTGHEMDSELSLINMNARLYSPVLGRFISADTIVPNPGDMQDFNRYAYVNNNPLAYIDPTGHWKLKNLWREVRRWVPVVLVAAASFYTGGYAMAAYQGVTFSGAVAGVATAGSYSFAGLASMSMGTAMVGGAVGGAIASSSMTALAGGSFDQIVQAGLLGGVGGAIGAGIGFQFAQYGMSGFGRMAGQSLSAGVQSDFDPRSMGRAFLMAGVASGASYVYDKIVGFGVEWKGGDRAIPKGPLALPEKDRIHIGFAGNPEGGGFWHGIFGEGNPLSRLLNYVPGLNGTAAFHDVMQVYLYKMGGITARNLLNIPGMIPSAMISYGSLLGGSPAITSLVVDSARQ